MKTPWEDLVNKNSNFEDFVRFNPHTYTCTQQFLPPLWPAITQIYKKKTDRQKMLAIKISSIDYIIETDLYREPTEQLLFAFTNKTPILL